MRKTREDRIDPGQPALIVTYGNTSRKVRPLDRDIVVLGRASCCDWNLVSPEVAPIHCLVVHVADGWRVRDCASRLGTRVNGKTVHDELLCDGDVLQVGSFSFQVQLPNPKPRPARPAPERPAPDPAPSLPANLGIARKLQRLERSRRQLARLALAWRRRCRRLDDGQVAQLRKELDDQATRLEARQRDLEACFAHIEQSETEVAELRAALDFEAQALQERRTQAERALEERQADSEARIQAAWEEFQGRCRQQEKEFLTSANTPTSLSEQVAALNVRARELDCLATHLQRVRDHLEEERQEFLSNQDDVREDNDRLGAALRESQAEVARLREEVRVVRKQTRPLASPALQALRQENERLRRQMAQKEEDYGRLREQLVVLQAETGVNNPFPGEEDWQLAGIDCPGVTPSRELAQRERHTDEDPLCCTLKETPVGSDTLSKTADERNRINAELSLARSQFEKEAPAL